MDPKPYAYDPLVNPELFDGVLARRVMAFLIDLVMIGIPIALGYLFIFLFGLITLGVGWMLFWFLSPVPLLWAIAYYGWSLGSPSSATLGMRVMELQMRTSHGEPCYFLLGAIHAILYWATVSFLSPFVLLVGLFNDRRRLLHDFLIGTVVINNPRRVQSLRAAE